MEPYQQYYVYWHIDPATDDIVYVGHGKGSRAWHFGSTNRSDDHYLWGVKQFDRGFLPTDFVEVIETGLTKTEACVREQEHIRELNPTFNKPMGLKQLKFTQEIKEQAEEMRREGLSFREIGLLLGLSTMTIYRGLTGETKNAS